MAKGKRPRILREEERVACAGWCPDGATVERRSHLLRRGWRRVRVPAFADLPIWICPECAARYEEEKEGAKGRGKMTDPLERYRQAWIQEQADRQKRLQAEEEAHRAVWRQRATEFIAKHALADLLAAFRVGAPEFPSSGWDIVFPLQIPYNGDHFTGTFSLMSGGANISGAIECDGHRKLYLPATDAAIGHWLVDIGKWVRQTVPVAENC